MAQENVQEMEFSEEDAARSLLQLSQKRSADIEFAEAENAYKYARVEEDGSEEMAVNIQEGQFQDQINREVIPVINDLFIQMREQELLEGMSELIEFVRGLRLYFQSKTAEIERELQGNSSDRRDENQAA